MRAKLILTLIYLCLTLLPVVAQDYMFKHLEVQDGLPNNQVNTILKDSRGFMWFGTASGLARYDGYSFKTFRSDANDPTSLSDNFIEQMTEDGAGRLWIRDGNGNYVIYNREAETFERDVRGYMKSIGVDGTPTMFYADKQNMLFFYISGQGLYRHTVGEKQASCLSIEEGRLPNGWVSDIAECDEGILMVYDNGCVVCVDKELMTVKWKLTQITDELHKGQYDSFFLFVDSDEDLWVYGALGVWIYSLNERQWTPKWEWASGNRLHDMVTTIAQDKNGYIWLGKNQEGIEIWDKKTGKRVFLSNLPDNDRSLPNNTITQIFEDEDGMMWVGTRKKGVAFYQESIYKFGNNRLGDINCIEEDGKGNLWLGTNDEGLVYWNPISGQRNVYTHTGENLLSTNIVVCLLHASDGRLWIGTFWGGLDCFDGQRFVHYRHQPGNRNSLSNDNVWSLAEDKEGNIWIGTLGGGVQRLNPRSGEFSTYDTTTSDISSNHISSICITRDNNLVIGTASSGIAIMDLTTGRITNLTGNRSGDIRFSNQSINQVYEDSRGLIWIGTRNGLNLYNLHKDRLQLVNLPISGQGQFISGIVEDCNRNMWVTTASGVVNVTLSQNANDNDYAFDFHAYDSKDGLQSCEFNQRSIKRLADGSIVMGGMYGINTFTPDHIKYNHTVPKVMFTNLLLFNEEVKIGQEYEGHVVLTCALDQTQEVTLKYRQNVFTVLFASDSYILPDKTRYSYKLEGFDNDWLTSPPDMHRVTYTNLAPGKYALKVKAINSDGYASTSEAMLKIIILPPFYRTPWAFALYTLALAGALCLLFYLMHRRERNRFKMKQLEEEAKKKEEINQMKFRFFTNISHELRTPLTLIISPLESMIKKTTDETQSGQLKMMHRNAVRLLNQVNQLLDFRKIEMAGMHLNLSEGDIVGFVRNICSAFQELSEKKNVNLTFYSPIETLNMAFDEDKMGKIIMNLLSNAFKFTPENGRVDVSIEPLKETADMLEIKVADTGIGISDKEKEHVFERFYQIEEESTHKQQVTGSGIGLSLVHDFVALHGGTVRVVDNVGKGSVFIIRIPAKYPEGKDCVANADNAVLIQTTDTASAPETTVAAQPAQTAPTASSSPAASLPDGKNKPLALVVDDNPDLISFMKESLIVDFRVQTASDGMEAWQMIPTLQPDIIVCDVMMPGMDGNELCHWVKTDKRTNRIPLILLTAKQRLEDKVEGLKVGADDYLTKPFNMEVLMLRMHKLIDLSVQNKPRTHIDPEPSEIVITSLDEQLVANAIKYVEDNIARADLSVEELSSALNMSRVHLYKRLLQITGKTPTEFIRIIRLKRSVQLLRESQLTVSEIAYRVGFNNPKYFTKYFKDEYGILPSVYQEKEGK